MDRTIKTIEHQLSLCSSPYVSFSCGKDSAALLHLVRSIDINVPARCLLWRGESENMGNHLDVIERTGNVEIFWENRSDLDDSRPERWNILHSDSDAQFIGLRAEESPARKKTLGRHGETFTKQDGMMRFCPLGLWSTRDIGALIASEDLPILSNYEARGMKSRTATRVPRTTVRDDMNMMRRTNPEGYRRLKEKFGDL